MKKNALLIVLMLQGLAGCEKPAVLYTITGTTMGTMYSAKIVNDEKLAASITETVLKNGIDRRLKGVNQHMSTYIDDSELSLFNRHRESDWFSISGDLARVLAAAHDISKKSNGAFDITVGPLVNLWGFGPESRPILIPSEAEIQERKALVGYKKLSLRLIPPAVKKEIPEMYCDLAAIAKGFGVDQVAEYLDSLAIPNYMIEIGGEIRVKGHNHYGQKWQIGIATPDNSFGIEQVIGITDVSVATSGDYRNYFEVDGARYSHTIDPATGCPITHKLASVTVIHPTCMIADGLATAINVLGPEKGYDLAIREHLPVLMIVRDKKVFVEKMTPDFKKIIRMMKNRN